MLLKNWQNYYIDNSKDLISQYQLPEEEKQLNHNKERINSTQTKLSPERNKILYSIMDENKQKVFIKNLITNKVEKIYSTPNNLNNYEIKLNWLNNEKVGIITYFNLNGYVRYPYIRSNDVLGIGTEKVKVLNVDSFNL